MKRDMSSVMSGVSMLVSLMCLAGVLHLEFRLYAREQIHNCAEKTAPDIKDSQGKDFPTAEVSRELNKMSKTRKGMENHLDWTEKSEHFEFEHNQNNDKHKVPLHRTRRGTHNSSLSISVSEIKRLIKEELENALRSDICARDKRMCLRGPKGNPGKIGPPGPSGPSGPVSYKDRGTEEDPFEVSSWVLTIKEPPKSIVVNQSDMAKFTCRISGNPTPNVTWSRRNASLPVGRHVIYSNGSLSIKQVMSEDSGSYVCMATNAKGKAEAQAELIVQVPPHLVQRPKSLSVKEGNDLYLSCAASGLPTPAISWSKSSGILPERSTTTSTGILSITNTGIDDEGTYICTADNLLGRATAHARVTIVPSLVFLVKPPSTSSHIVGSRVVLNCQASNSAEILWLKNDKPVGSPVISYRNGTLVILKSTVKDAGVYVCIAKMFRRQIKTKIQLKIRIPRTPNELKNIPPKSCSELKEVLPDTPSGNYVIDPDGQLGEPSFTVFCSMKERGGVGVTVISHDSEGRTPVLGVPMRPGSFRHDVTYEPSMDQIGALTDASSDCEQYIEFECKGDVLFITASYAWWVSRDNVRQDYWGGATPGSKKCACGMTNSCQGEPWGCNCNNKLLGTRNDSGLLTDRSTLPVTQLRFGDTDDYNEQGYYTLGELKCYGQT